MKALVEYWGETQTHPKRWWVTRGAAMRSFSLRTSSEWNYSTLELRHCLLLFHKLHFTFVNHDITLSLIFLLPWSPLLTPTVTNHRSVPGDGTGRCGYRYDLCLQIVPHKVFSLYSSRKNKYIAGYFCTNLYLTL